jgi:hypothetical protein
MDTTNPITFCISSFNNLNYLKLAVHSVRKYSYFKDAPFIIHLENNTDGSNGWLLENKDKYNLTPIIEPNNNVLRGIGGGIDICADQVKTEYIMFLHADFFVSKNWDLESLKIFEKYPNIPMCVSSYRIQPNIFHEESASLKKNPTNLCSQIKIFNQQFNIKQKQFKYNFEALFELIIGSELYTEQFERYTQIINKIYDNKVLYDNEDTKLINYLQTGGYPLHHFMMGKGKSAIITPLLSLYYTLIEHKRVYIIVPDHLVEQTMITIKAFAFIFNIKFMVIKDRDENNKIIKVDEKKLLLISFLFNIADHFIISFL